jgi:lysozyme
VPPWGSRGLGAPGMGLGWPGVDVSSNNHPGGAPIDWAAVRGAGYSFAIVKVCEGPSYVNPFAESDLAGAAAAGLHTAGYLFFHPALDPVLQADLYLAQSWAPVGVAIDCEITEGVTFPEISAGIARCANTLGAAGKQVFLYADMNMSRFLVWAGLRWIADYSPVEPFEPGMVCWQHTDAGVVAGIAGPVDLNRWTGSFLAYQIFFDLPSRPPLSLGGQTMLVVQIGLSGQPGSGIYLLRGCGPPIPLAPSEVTPIQNALGQPSIPTVEASFLTRTDAS